MIGQLIGSALSIGGALFGHQQNVKSQERFAKNAITWRVRDAQRAGLHPLVALGAMPHSFAGTTIGSDLSAAGQDVGRAISAYSDRESRRLQLAIANEQLQSVRLDNEIKRVQLLSKLSPRAGTASGVPQSGSDPYGLGGQADAAIKATDPTIKIETRRDVASPEAPAVIPGHGPSVGFMRNTTGGYTPVIPPELAESLESDAAGRLDWFIRNRILPNLGYGEGPRVPVPEGYELRWSVPRQQWEIRRIPRTIREGRYYR